MLIAAPNLAIDRTLTGGELRPGEVLRFSARVAPGGKGINVARSVRALGGAAALVAFVPGHTGVAAAAMIAEEGIALLGVRCAGELRSSSVILEAGGRSTVINEAGPAITSEQWGGYEERVASALAGERLLACSGSLPPGAPADAYARLCAIAHDRGALCVVDGPGEQLRAALTARPDVVCPNVAEAELALGTGDGSEPVDAAADARERALAAAGALVARGARAAVVTAAAAGAALAQADGVAPNASMTSPASHPFGDVAWLAAPAVHVRNPVGAGDALVAGLAVALERGAPAPDAAREGMAAAAASVEDEHGGRLDPERASELLARIAPA